jgi:very-short-patch-repair endonuclease
VRLLRRYLEYADQGPRALLGEITSEGGDFESPFEESVAAALTARGLRVVSQVGVSGYRIDLGIKDEQVDRYLLGVECDGATYHSARTARDRDRLRQQVLENLGWHIHRVWSTDWIKDPARETERILAALEHARSAPSQPAPVREEPLPAPQLSPDPALLPATTEEAPPRAEIAVAAPYRAAQLPPQGDIEQFRSAHSHDLAQLVRAVVAVEGPVHQDRVMRAVAGCFGITRLGNQVRAQLERAIAAAVRANFATRRGDFLWSPDMTAPPVREDGGRVIGEMPPEELAAGIIALLDAAFSLPRDELITAAARAFGYDRTGNHVGAGFARALDALLANGTLTEVGGQICLDR